MLSNFFCLAALWNWAQVSMEYCSWDINALEQSCWLQTTTKWDRSLESSSLAGASSLLRKSLAVRVGRLSPWHTFNDLSMSLLEAVTLSSLLPYFLEELGSLINWWAFFRNNFLQFYWIHCWDLPIGFPHCIYRWFCLSLYHWVCRWICSRIWLCFWRLYSDVADILEC